jgi:valyl-tRNA synthetase
MMMTAKVYVAESEAAAQAQAGEAVALTRDEDVLGYVVLLGAVARSQLWVGQAVAESEETKAFIKRHYKTDVLVTGFDIIFFWVARMIMSGLHFRGR